MTRREFTRNQKEQIIKRSRNGRGDICCEGCGLVLAGKPYEIDHIIAEALRPDEDKQRAITIEEGQLLGKDCCHRGEDGKTNRDVKLIAKAKRQNARHLGIKKPKGAIPTRPKQPKPKRDRLDIPPRVNIFTRESIR